MTEPIKSAFDRAMEKVEKLEKASREEMEREQYLRQGNILAARYLRGEIEDLAAELSRHDSRLRGYLLRGALDTLLANIGLPRDARAKGSAGKAIQGMTALRKGDRGARESLEQMQQLFTYYEKTLEQMYGNFKRDFEARLGEARRALERQTGTAVKVDVERHPEFQEQWRRARASIDMQYEAALEDLKRRILPGG